jgi:hypothetical protein
VSGHTSGLLAAKADSGHTGPTVTTVRGGGGQARWSVARRSSARAALAGAVGLAGVLFHFHFLECGLPDLLMLAMRGAQLLVGGVLEREQ